MPSRLEEMRRQAQEFHDKHPEVWTLFVKFVSQVIHRGYRHYSVNAIFERIRWEKDVVGGDGVSSFKLNNNYRAFYARRFHKAFPQHGEFFRTRHQTSADERATGLPELTPGDFQ